ncbi:MAG: PaaI family thioesterase [Chloroflexi bacterium]|nr:MAG: PaaI family thioesterase [Chloroflexota bacterium]
MDNPQQPPARERTFTWQSTASSVEQLPNMSGLEFLHAIIAGDLPQPPMAYALNFYLAEAEPGKAVFIGEPGEFHYNPLGVVHGGFASTLLDSAMACACHTTLPQGIGFTTLELKINLVRAITVATGTLRAEGEALHTGKRVLTAAGKLIDADGKLYAHGTTTCLAFPLA